MYIHIFAFRWTEAATELHQAQAADQIRAFQGAIPGLVETSVGANISPRGRGYTFCGLMKFTSEPVYTAYQSHPLHQALLAWLIPLMEPIELDFEA